MATPDSSNGESSGEDNRNIFRDRVQQCIAGLDTIRQFTAAVPNKKRKRQPGKRGPKSTSVRLKFYLLPDGSDIPKLSKNDPLISTHMNHGYGYPAGMFIDGKAKPVAIPNSLSPDEVKEEIRNLFPRLRNKPFLLYILSQQKRLTVIPFDLAQFKDNRFQGNIIIKIQDTLQEEQSEQFATNDEHGRAEVRDVPLNIHTEISQITTTPNTTPVSTTTNINSASDVNTTPVTSNATHIHTTPLTSTDTINSATWITAGTPEVSFHPRHTLRLQQDIEFTQSLAADRQKAYERRQAIIRRNLERLERRRKREELKAEAVKNRQRILEEFENDTIGQDLESGVNIVFQLPQGREIRRTFSTTEILSRIHLYVEAVSEVQSAKIIHNRQTLPKDSTSLKDIGITVNTRLIIENDNDDDKDELVSSSEEIDSDDDEEEEHSESQNTDLKDLNELEHRRISVFDNLLPRKILKVRRDNIVQDVLDHYRLDPSLVHHTLDVQFDGEENAVDLSGVTREMFVEFTDKVMSSYFVGNQEKSPAFDTRILFNGTFELIGRIFCHGFVLTTYLSPVLSKTVYAIALCKACSDDTFLSTFMKYLRDDEVRVLNMAKEMKTFTQEAKLQLANFVSTYEGREMITPNNIHNVTLSLAKTVLFAKPMLALAELSRGLQCYPSLWHGVSLSLIEEYLNNSKPTAERILQIIDYQFSEDVALRLMEERVQSYLERFISGLCDVQLEKFLQFWTASNTLCLRNLYVCFNSLEGLQRRPISNTCSASLQLSRFYLSATEFCDEMMCFLGHTSSRVFDSI